MTEFVDGFILTDVADVHRWFARCLEDAKRLAQDANRSDNQQLARRAQGVADDVQRAWDQYNIDLRMAAERGAQDATKGMRDRIESTRKRASAGDGAPLKQYVEALPLAAAGSLQTGAVGVGNVDLLNQAVNPRGYGPYWRALEYGTGRGEVPSQKGRVIYGSFAEAGGSNPTPPQAQYRGGGGPHPLFVAKGVSGPGRTRGLGTISTEIEPKEFISKGADAAAIEWRQNIMSAQQRGVDVLQAAVKTLLA